MTSSHAAVAPARSCLPNALTIPRLRQRLGVLRVDPQRLLDLADRAVGLIGVVVADAEIRADIDVAGVRLNASSYQRIASWYRSASKYMLPSWTRDCTFCGVLLGDVPERRGLRFVERRACRRRAAGGRRRLRGRRPCGGDAHVACWVPITQPTIRPNSAPVTAKTIKYSLHCPLIIATCEGTSPPARSQGRGRGEHHRAMPRARQDAQFAGAVTHGGLPRGSQGVGIFAARHEQRRPRAEFPERLLHAEIAILEARATGTPWT